MSRLADMIAKRERRMHVYDIGGFFNLRGDAIPKLAVRVPLKGEQDKAIDAAHKAITDRVASAESAKSDEDIIRDLKILHIVWASCFDTTVKQKPDGSGNYHDPAFPAPEWMRDNLKTEEIAVLLNLLNLARRDEGPGPPDCDDITVETFVNMVVEAGGTEASAELLAACGREFCVELFMKTAKKLFAARAELADALAREGGKEAPPDQQAAAGASDGHGTQDGPSVPDLVVK
jgi:hypothetical protein